MGSGQDHRRRPRAAAGAGLQRLSPGLSHGLSHTVEVPAARLGGWVTRYAATHPGTVVVPVGVGLELRATNGAVAALTPLVPFEPDPATGAEGMVGALATHAARPVVTALLLLRRGGYAVGVAVGPALVTSKVGSRYVQSRTAAGGSSQQRFARRREGQATQLVRAAARAWVSLAATDRPSVVVTGGDRALCSQLLEEPGLRDLHALGTARHLDVPDPRLAVLRSAAERAQALVVTVREP